MAKRTTEAARDVERAVGGAALLASITGNLAQHRANAELARNVEALEQVVKDWQQSYSMLEAQLSMALSVNQELNSMVTSLREALRQAQGRAYAAEERLLQQGAKVGRADDAEVP